MRTKPHRIVVRRARIGDQPAIESLYRQLHEGDYASPGAARMRRAMSAVFKDRNHVLLVATVGGKVAGTLHVLIFAHLARKLRPEAIVENVVVDAAWRGAGAGERLVAAAIEIARRRDCYKIALTSNRRRKEAHRFYQHLGWRWSHLGYSIYF